MSLTPERIQNRDAVVSVVGLGYVGLPMVSIFAQGGFRTIGLDVDAAKVAQLAAGQTPYTQRISAKSIQAALAAGFEPTTDVQRLAASDAVLICVPTPLTPQLEPDMGYVVTATEAVAAHVKDDVLVVLQSTVYPGATAEILRPILERSGKRVRVAYSPEWGDDPADSTFDWTAHPKVVGADDPTALETAGALFGAVFREVVPCTTRVAEAAKVFTNAFRAVNIALVNELKVAFDSMGIDVWSVIDVAARKPFAHMRHTPGPGVGGHCIPIDPYYLRWKAREYGATLPIVELAGDTNRAMPLYVVRRTMEAFSDRGKGLRGARILIVGLGFKPNSDDVRASPALELMQRFDAHGARVEYHDPYVAVAPDGRRSVTLETAAECDAAIIVTNHDCVDWDALLAMAPLVVDTRGIYPRGHDNVVRA